MSKQAQYIPVTTYIDSAATIRAAQHIKYYVDADDTVLAIRFCDTGIVADLREKPLYLPLSPCPYCGAERDRNHIATDHVDPFLGTPNE